MKMGFYNHLAVIGMKKNKQLYKPYLLASSSMAAIYYIVSFLQDSAILKHTSGAEQLRQILMLGSFVIGMFSAIFLFYTHSFLIRRRNREFGLYNILGMGKGSIARILLQETILTLFLTLFFGFGAGVILSKLAELCLLNLIGAKVTYDFSVSVHSLIIGGSLFSAIFVLLYLYSLARIRLSNPAQLLDSEAVGEKPPKANWLVGILGFVLLGVAYYQAVRIEQPLTAMVWFFLAVLMVIVATYLIFIAGSVWILRLLQKRKGYYYKTKHFVSVSSMVYRMKRNGAGLASICILSTMVLVMISSTACLFCGKNEVLKKRYPRNTTATISFRSVQDNQSEVIERCRKKVDDILKKEQVRVKNVYEYEYASTYGILENNRVGIDVRDYDRSKIDYDKMVNVIFLDAKYYEQFGGKADIPAGKVWLYASELDYQANELTVGDTTFSVAKHLKQFDTSAFVNTAYQRTIVLIVPDFDEAVKDLKNATYNASSHLLSRIWSYDFDVEGSDKEQLRVADAINSAFVLEPQEEQKYGIFSRICNCLAANKESFLVTFGGMFFIGMMLSVAFILATVLVIYYKQVSEGYEDRARFEIMQNVGMTKREIKSSINSQMLTVFLSPIAFAVCHMAFAFPLVRKLLLLFSLDNTRLFLLVLALSVGVFFVVYTIIYRVTSNAYYNIVCGFWEETA